MLCTECGRSLKPISVIDIDGVLGDYHTQFTEFSENYYNIELPRGYKGDMEFSDFLGMEKGSYRQAKLAYRQGGVKRWMPRFSGATPFMNDLADLGVEIWIASTRPWDRLDNIDPDTRHWLERYKMPFDYMLYGDDKFEQLSQQINPDRVICVVEDQIQLCFQAENLFGDVVWQPDLKHTEGQPYSRRFQRWEEVLVDVEAKARRFK